MVTYYSIYVLWNRTKSCQFLRVVIFYVFVLIFDITFACSYQFRSIFAVECFSRSDFIMNVAKILCGPWESVNRFHYRPVMTPASWTSLTVEPLIATCRFGLPACHSGRQQRVWHPVSEHWPSLRPYATWIRWGSAWRTIADHPGRLQTPLLPVSFFCVFFPFFNIFIVFSFSFLKLSLHHAIFLSQEMKSTNNDDFSMEHSFRIVPSFSCDREVA